MVGLHRPVFYVSDDVGPAVGRNVAQVTVQLHLHLRLFVFLFFVHAGEVRMQPLEVERRGEDVALDAFPVLWHCLRLLLEQVQRPPLCFCTII